MDDPAPAAAASGPAPVADETPSVTSAAAADTRTHDADADSTMTPARAVRLLVEAGVVKEEGAAVVQRVERLSGGNTNITYRVDLKAGQSFILRLFGQGTEALIDRAQEARCFHAVARRGLGPRLLGDFEGGRIEEFIHGRAPTASEMRGPEVAAAVARQFRALHAIDAVEEGLDPARAPQLFPQLRAWAKLALEKCGPCFQGVDVAAFPHEIDRLEARLLSLKSPVCLCHNDLNHMNILLLDSDEEGRRRVAFIDLEYAGWNFRGFDLGNHLCEYASDFLQPHAHALDFGRYPSVEQRRAFARAYLGKEEGDGEEEVSALVREMDGFALASHLYWGVWGLVQARISAIGSFDFAAYARQRLDMYAKGIMGGRE